MHTRPASWRRGGTSPYLGSVMRCLLVLVVVAVWGVDVIARPPRYNVLFIAVDDMRAELGCYGASYVHSPSIDRLSQRGIVFTRAYCQQALCNPSRASLLCGRRPDSLGVVDLPTHFRDKHPELITLPQWFKLNGYFTQCIGKIFHNWRQDAYSGDAVSWSVPAVMHYDSHSHDKPRVEGEVPPNLSDVPRTEMRDVPDDAYFDGRIANLAIEALRERKAARQPFFLAVGFWKPHAPFNAPKRYWDMNDESDVSLPANPQPPQYVPSIALHDSREILRGFRDHPGGRPTVEEVRDLRRGYFSAISYVDAQIGRVLDALDTLGLAESTIVVFWSDHGYHLGEHGLWAKTSNFELDTRVPLLIATPDRTGGNAGATCDALVELLDLYPTLVELCGLPMPDGLEGTSLVPLIREPGGSPIHSAVYSQHPRLFTVSIRGQRIRPKGENRKSWGTRCALIVFATPSGGNMTRGK